MKSQIKRTLAVFLAVLMVCLSFPSAVFAAGETNELLTDGIFTFTVRNGGAALVNVRKGYDGKVTIPAELGGYPVTSIAPNGMREGDFTAVEIPGTVKTIGSHAFGSCTKLAEVSIGNGVESIGEQAFVSCIALKEITIPGSVETIAAKAFAYCLGLERVVLEQGVKTIGDMAFMACHSMKYFEVPSSVTGNLVLDFFECDEFMQDDCATIVIPEDIQLDFLELHSSDAEEITIPNGVAGFIISHCPNLKTVNISAGAGNSDFGGFDLKVNFYNCQKLESINAAQDNEYFCSADGVLYSKDMTELIRCPQMAPECNIPKSVSYIHGGAFNGCTELTSIEFPAGLQGDVIYDCTNIKTLKLSDNWNEYSCRLERNIYGKFADAAPAVESYIIDENNPNYCSVGGAVYSKDMSELILVPNTVTSFTIPASVKTIGESAFRDCRNLTEIIIPETVEFLNIHTFWGSGITELTIPETCEVSGALVYAQNLQTLNLPAGCFDSISFESVECKSLTAVNISADDEEYRSVDGVVFNKDMTRLVYVPAGIKSYTVPESVKTIGNEAFKHSNIEKVVLPSGLKEISSSAFSFCSKLKSIDLPDGLEKIDFYAFQASAIREIVIPDSVTSIGGYAFANCTYLESVKLSKNLVSSGVKGGDAGYFQYCVSLKNVEIPDGVKSIEIMMFILCSSLEEVTLPESVEVINTSAFAGCCSLKNLNIENPNAVIIKDEVSPDNSLGYENIQFESIGSIADYWYDVLTLGKFGKTLAIENFENGEMIIDDDFSLVSHGITNITDLGYSPKAYSEKTGVNFRHFDLEFNYIAVPTCTEDGFASGDCALCGYHEDMVIPNLDGHLWDEGVVTLEPTADLPGEKTLTCMRENCAAQCVVEIPALGACEHVWVIESKAEPTCTEEGSVTYKCALCDELKTEAVLPLGHNFIKEVADEAHLASQATCMAPAKYYYSCDRCAIAGTDAGDTFEYGEKADHVFSDWYTTKEPTVFLGGEEERACTVCGLKETRETDRLPGNVAGDPESGVHIIFPDHAFDEDVQVTANHINNGDLYDKIQDFNTEHVEVFDVNVYNMNGDKVQPNGKILIKIPVPQGFDAKNCSAYYIPETGKPQRVQSYYEDGYIYLETDHFSYYAIVDETPENPSENCSCMCHRGGFMGFIYKIFRFLWKIFGINKTCECGVKHY